MVGEKGDILLEDLIFRDPKTNFLEEDMLKY